MSFKSESKYFCILVLFALISMLNLSYQANSTSITLTTNKEVYSPDDELIVSGTATPNYYITITVKNPYDEIVWVDLVKAAENGSFSKAILRFPESFTEEFPPGNYTLIATDGYTGEQAEASVIFAETVVTVTTTITTTATSTITLTTSVPGPTITITTTTTEISYVPITTTTTETYTTTRAELITLTRTETSIITETASPSFEAMMPTLASLSVIGVIVGVAIGYAFFRRT
ncbi:hypothetical protein DRN86_00895 [Candidatus Geothermarchaeota archaeon]|nr:MAG: hypothetical protein DRN86_00895 [Candidatus Geothermarchaeota archaeon]